MQRRTLQPDSTPWVATEATVTSSKRVFMGYASWSDGSYTPAEYRIRFRYLANGRTFDGSYRASLPVDIGHQFTIGYDPAQPARNTGSDLLDNPWYQWVARVFGVLATVLLLWFLHNKGLLS